jgi:hypothetical protein
MKLLTIKDLERLIVSSGKKRQQYPFKMKGYIFRMKESFYALLRKSKSLQPATDVQACLITAAYKTASVAVKKITSMPSPNSLSRCY